MAESAEEALLALGANGCDLVITDITLPGMDGIELTERVRAQQPDLPIVVVSAHDGPLYMERARAAGARAYLTKGEVGRDLIHTLHYVLAGRSDSAPRRLRPTSTASHEQDRAPAASPSRVVIVDDHEVVLFGLRALLEREGDFTVCAEAKTAEEGFRAIERCDPDLLLTDLQLEGTGGLSLIRQVHRYHPALPILVVSMHDEALYAHRVRAAGARGYVHKRRAATDVVPAARALLAGQTFFDGHVGDDEATPGRPDGAPHRPRVGGVPPARPGLRAASHRREALQEHEHGGGPPRADQGETEPGELTGPHPLRDPVVPGSGGR